MHIILGFLGFVVTIVILLKRLADAGIDLGGLNPFAWNRRRNWRNQYEGNPVFKVDSPMQATAILMLAAAKSDGDLTAESKQHILSLFESDFKLSSKDAAGLLTSSSHLLGDGLAVRNQVNAFLEPSKEKFSEEQKSSAVSLLNKVIEAQPEVPPNAKDLLAAVKAQLDEKAGKDGTW